MRLLDEGDRRESPAPDLLTTAQDAPKDKGGTLKIAFTFAYHYTIHSISHVVYASNNKCPRNQYSCHFPSPLSLAGMPNFSSLHAHARKPNLAPPLPQSSSSSSPVRNPRSHPPSPPFNFFLFFPFSFFPLRDCFFFLFPLPLLLPTHEGCCVGIYM